MNIETLEESQFATLIRHSPDGLVERMSNLDIYFVLESVGEQGELVCDRTFAYTLDS